MGNGFGFFKGGRIAADPLGRKPGRGGLSAGGMVDPGVVGGWGPGVAGAAPEGYCNTDIGGPKGEPWAILSSTEVAAGALSANTDLAEVFDASQSSQIGTDNQVPDFFRSTHIRIYLGVQAVDDGGIENAGLMGQLFLRETVGSGGGQERGIYSLGDLGAQVGAFGGYGTSTGTGTSNYSLAVAVAPWNRVYEPRETYSLAYRLTFADTTLNVLVFTTQLVGRRRLASR